MRRGVGVLAGVWTGNPIALVEMDVQVIHPPWEGPVPAISLTPLLDLLAVCGKLQASGLSTDVIDGSFESLDRVIERTSRSARPRVALVHVPRTGGASRRGAPSAFQVERRLREEDIAVVAFGEGAKADPEPHLRAGADAVAGSNAEIPKLLEALSITPWGEGPARIPSIEALLSLPGLTVLDLEGKVQTSTAGPGPRTYALPAYDVVDLERHLDRTERRVGRRLLPVRAEVPTVGSAWAAGHRLAAWLLRVIEMHPNAEPRFVDQDLALDRSFLRGLCDGLHGGLQYPAKPVSWSARVDAHHVDQPLLERMRAAGCRRVTVCAEAFAERCVSVAGPLLADAERVARAATRLGIEVALELGVGHPGEGPKDLDLALKWLEDLAPLRARLVWRGPERLGGAERRLLAGLAEAARQGNASRKALFRLWLAWMRAREAGPKPWARGPSEVPSPELT